jgi:hypothetical protein
MGADDCTWPLWISYKNEVSVQRSAVSAARALHYGDVEVVQGSRGILGRIEGRECFGEPRQQLVAGFTQGLLLKRSKRRPHNAHGKRVDITANHVRAKARCLDKRRAAARERIEHALTSERTLGGAEQSPEVFYSLLGVEVVRNEQPPKKRGWTACPPSVYSVDRIANSPIGLDHEGEFAKGKALFEEGPPR